MTQTASAQIYPIQREPSKCTLERIRVQKPLQLKEAIDLLGQGTSQRETAEVTGLSRPVIFQISEQYQEEIGPLKLQAARQCRKVHIMATEAAIGYLERHFDPDDDFQLAPNLVSVYAGVFIEKELLLSGDATSRTETVKKKVDYAHIDEILKDLPGVTEIMDINPTIIKQDI